MDISNYSGVKGTSIKLVSLTGEVIQEFSNNTRAGASLTCLVDERKVGGVYSVEFSIDRRSNIPVFSGMIVEVYKDQELFATCYTNSIPRPAGDSNILTIECLGYMHKLKQEKLTKTYTSTLLSDVVADLSTDLSSVDVIYDASLVDLPATTVSSLDFQNKTLEEILETVLQVANVDFNNSEYRWFIDKHRKLNFELIPQDAIRALFEGFNFQNPEVTVDDGELINQLVVFKGDTSGNELVYVDTYNDVESQENNGIYSENFVFTDDVDDVTIQSMAEGIIQRFKDPETKVQLKNLEGTDYPFKFYNLNTRTDKYWVVLSECDTLDNWDVTNAPNTSITASTEQVLTGRRAIKAVTGSGSLGEYIDLVLDTPVFSPQTLRFYVYLGDGGKFDLTLYDDTGAEQNINYTLGSSTFNMEADQDESTTVNIAADQDGATTVNLELTSLATYFNQWLKLEIPLDFRTLKTLRITFGTDAETTTYFDRFEVLSESYNTDKLSLEKIVYNLDRDYALSVADFGRALTTFSEAILEKTLAGDVSLSLAAR